MRHLIRDGEIMFDIKKERPRVPFLKCWYFLFRGSAKGKSKIALLRLKVEVEESVWTGQASSLRMDFVGD
jgi:hypothetical protein